MNGTQAYALGKKYTDGSISGITGTLAGKNCKIKSVVKSGEQNTVTFEWTADDGTVNTSTMTVDDGAEITSASVDSNNHLILTMSDGNTVDAGEMPKEDVRISAESGNALTMKTDGLYVSATGVEISAETGNQLQTKADGLFVPATDISGKVDKVDGKSLVSDTDITQITTNKNAITTLNGNSTVAGSVDKKIADAVGNITSFDYEVVASLPSTGVKGKIYLVANGGTTPNVYDEYIWIGDKFEKIGTTEVDLTQYFKNENIVTSFSTTTSDSKVASEKLVKASLDDKVDKVTGKGLSTNDYDDTEKAQVAKIAGKIDRAQGTVNAGKILVVGSNGNVTLERRDVVSAWETTPVDTNVPSEKLVKDNLDEINADLTAQVELGYLRNKNLVDGVLNGVIDSSGNITSGSGDKTTVVFYALANTKYTVSGSNRDRSRVVRCTEKPKIGSKGTIVIDNDSTTTFITPVGGWYAWYMSSTSDSTPQVEKGSVATSYVEPNGKSNAELTKLVNDDLKMLGWTVPSECPIQNYTDANGVFHQRVGRVDLGSLTWTKPSSEHFFWANFDGCKINGKSYANTSIGTAYIHDKQQKVCFDATDITDISVLTQSLSGVYLYYELATEVTKSVDGNEVEFSQDTWTLLGSINLGTTQTLTFTKPSKYSELFITVYSQTAYYLRWNENLPHTGDYYPLADWGQKVRFGDNASCFEMTIKNGQLVVDIANGINIDLLNDNATTVELFYR